MLNIDKTTLAAKLSKDILWACRAVRANIGGQCVHAVYICLRLLCNSRVFMKKVACVYKYIKARQTLNTLCVLIGQSLVQLQKTNSHIILPLSILILKRIIQSVRHVMYMYACSYTFILHLMLLLQESSNPTAWECNVQHD